VKKQSKQYAPEGRHSEAAFAGEGAHLQLCDEVGLQPTVFFRWQKFFRVLCQVREPVFRLCAWHGLSRGQARLGDFRKLLDHRRLVLADPAGVLADFQLGRALVLSGDLRGAKTSYRDLLTLWKDADPETPIRTKAKAEYDWLR
jgi:hypothetical protein